jgi:hypothetical protein
MIERKDTPFHKSGVLIAPSILLWHRQRVKFLNKPIVTKRFEE